MQRAPSVIYPVGRCAWLGWVLLALAALLLTVWWAWWWFSASTGRLLPSLGGAACLAWCVVAWCSWRKPVAGQLHWDARFPGQDDGPTGRWLWHTEPGLVGIPLQSVAVVFDGQVLAWLRLQGPAQVPGWVCVQQTSDAARWNDLRRAWMQAWP